MSVSGPRESELILSLQLQPTRPRGGGLVIQPHESCHMTGRGTTAVILLLRCHLASGTDEWAAKVAGHAAGSGFSVLSCHSRTEGRNTCAACTEHENKNQGLCCFCFCTSSEWAQSTAAPYAHLLMVTSLLLSFKNFSHSSSPRHPNSATTHSYTPKHNSCLFRKHPNIESVLILLISCSMFLFWSGVTWFTVQLDLSAPLHLWHTLVSLPYQTPNPTQHAPWSLLSVVSPLHLSLAII